MILASIPELSLIGVYDRGIANQERIVFQANQSINMGQFGIMLGYRTTHGFANPYIDHLFWFGDGDLLQGDWVFVYTGRGEPRISDVPEQNQKLYILHWGKENTIFAQPEVTPILFRADAVQVELSPLNLPHDTGNN
jgi:hypothetical protein